MAEQTRYGVSLRGYRSTFAETLLTLGREYPDMVVMDAETGTATNIMGFRDAFPDRYLTTGVAEQAVVSMAASLARSGFIPVIPLFGSFLTRRACDQIFVQIGYAGANVKLIGCYSGLTTPNTGATHQSINDLAMLRSMPGITVVEPADFRELEQALREMMAWQGPMYLRMPRGDVTEFDRLCTPDDHRFAIGKASVLREGTDVSLIACGIMVPRALKAAELLAARCGVSAEVVNCSSIKPLDAATLVASARKTGRAVTAENHGVHGGMGGAVAELFAEQCPTPMRLVGIRDQYGCSGALEELLEHYRLTAEEIAAKAEELLK